MEMNQVTLPVSDIALANEFYRRLGFTQIVESPHYSRFECPGGASFSLSLDEEEFSNGTVVYFENEALDEWVESLVVAGIEFDQLPQDESYLWREAVVHDPSGNKIKLYWAGENRLNPPWRVNIRADGAVPSSSSSFWSIASSTAVVRRALRVALVVGVLLFLINYTDRLLSGAMNTADWLKVALTFLVPYGVSTWSAVGALRGEKT